MAHSESDIAELFAPLAPAQASSVVLSEARQVLAHIHQPIDAELWGSDMIGALSGHGGGGDGAEVMAELGLTPGPQVGAALAFLLEIRLEEGLLGDEAIRERLLSWWQAQRADD